LKTKDRTRYVLGTIAEPPDKESSEWKKGSFTDSLILTKLLTSLIPAIAASVEAFRVPQMRGPRCPRVTTVWETSCSWQKSKTRSMLFIKGQKCDGVCE
jgi:hypothetical protein